MNRRFFLLGALVAPLATILGKADELKKENRVLRGMLSDVSQLTPRVETSNALVLTQYKTNVVRSTAVPLDEYKLSWYDIGDVVEIEGRSYHVVRINTRKVRLGKRDWFVGDAYLEELKYDLAPKADPRFAAYRNWSPATLKVRV